MPSEISRRGPSISPSSIAARKPASAPPMSRAVVIPQASVLAKDIDRAQHIVRRCVEQMLAHVARTIGAVDVAVDESRQNGAARRVEALGASRNCYVCLGTRCNYPPVLNNDDAGPDRVATKSV